MDWADFFERTRVAAGVDSFSKLAPLLEITDGAIGHYRQGRRVPQVWVVAQALTIQGHPTPEKAAIEIMKKAALTSPERAFWKRLGATAALLMIVVAPTLSQQAHAATLHALPHAAAMADTGAVMQVVLCIMRNGSWGAGLVDKALALVPERLFIADILGSPTQRFCPSTRTILLGRKPMQTISDDLATNAEKSGQLDAVERFFSRLTHCNSSSCGIVRPASTSAKPSRVRRSFSAADSSGSKANSSSSRVIYVEKQVLRSDCTWRRWDGSWDQPGVRAMVGGHRGPPSRPRRPVLRLGTE